MTERSEVVWLGPWGQGTDSRPVRRTVAVGRDMGEAVT
jgi:hypothetical protein